MARLKNGKGRYSARKRTSQGGGGASSSATATSSTPQRPIPSRPNRKSTAAPPSVPDQYAYRNCFNCGKLGHRAAKCPEEKDEERIKRELAFYKLAHHKVLPGLKERAERGRSGTTPDEGRADIATEVSEKPSTDQMPGESSAGLRPDEHKSMDEDPLPPPATVPSLNAYAISTSALSHDTTAVQPLSTSGRQPSTNTLPIMPVPSWWTSKTWPSTNQQKSPGALQLVLQPDPEPSMAFEVPEKNQPDPTSPARLIFPSDSPLIVFQPAFVHGFDTSIQPASVPESELPAGFGGSWGMTKLTPPADASSQLDQLDSDADTGPEAGTTGHVPDAQPEYGTDVPITVLDPATDSEVQYSAGGTGWIMADEKKKRSSNAVLAISSDEDDEVVSQPSGVVGWHTGSLVPVAGPWTAVWDVGTAVGFYPIHQSFESIESEEEEMEIDELDEDVEEEEHDAGVDADDDTEYTDGDNSRGTPSGY